MDGHSHTHTHTHTHTDTRRIESTEAYECVLDLLPDKPLADGHPMSARWGWSRLSARDALMHTSTQDTHGHGNRCACVHVGLLTHQVVPSGPSSSVSDRHTYDDTHPSIRAPTHPLIRLCVRTCCAARSSPKGTRVDVVLTSPSKLITSSPPYTPQSRHMFLHLPVLCCAVLCGRWCC